MKFHRGKSSKAKKNSIPLPAKEKILAGNTDGGVGSNSRQVVPDIRLRSTDSGSKDETFFETWPWLDSDCEDEFFSVNGDFTPNNQTTPSQAHKLPTLETILKTEPQKPAAAAAAATETKQRKLADLLQEKQEGEEKSSTKPENGNAAAAEQVPKSVDTASDLSRTYSSSRIDMPLSVKLIHDNEEGVKAKQCCMPRFVRSLSYRDRRKHK